MIIHNFKIRTYQLLFVFFVAFCSIGLGFSGQLNQHQLNSYDSNIQERITIADEDGQYDITTEDQIWRSNSDENEFFIVVADQELKITFSSLQATTQNGDNSEILMKGISVQLSKVSDQGIELFFNYKIVRKFNDDLTISYKIFDGPGDTQIAYTNIETSASLLEGEYHFIDKHADLNSQIFSETTSEEWVIASDASFLVALASMLAGETNGQNVALLTDVNNILLNDAKELFALIELRFAELDIAEWTNYGSQLIKYDNDELGLGFKLNIDWGGAPANKYFQLIYKPASDVATYQVIAATNNNYESNKISPTVPVEASDSFTTAAATRTALLKLFRRNEDDALSIATKQHAKVLFEGLSHHFATPQTILGNDWTLVASEAVPTYEKTFFGSQSVFLRFETGATTNNGVSNFKIYVFNDAGTDHSVDSHKDFILFSETTNIYPAFDSTTTVNKINNFLINQMAIVIIGSDWTAQSGGNVFASIDPFVYTKVFGTYTLRLELKTQESDIGKIKLSYAPEETDAATDYIIGTDSAWVAFSNMAMINDPVNLWQAAREAKGKIQAAGWTSLETKGQTVIYSKIVLENTVFLNLKTSTAADGNGGEFQLYILSPSGVHGNVADMTFIPTDAFQTPFDAATVLNKINAFLINAQFVADTEWIAGLHNIDFKIYMQDFSGLIFTVKIGINAASENYAKIAISSTRSDGAETWITSDSASTTTATQLTAATLADSELLITTWVINEIAKFTNGLTSAGGWTIDESNADYNTFTSSTTDAFPGNSFTVKVMKTGTAVGTYELYSNDDSSTEIISPATYWDNLGTITDAINNWNTDNIDVVNGSLKLAISDTHDETNTSKEKHEDKKEWSFIVLLLLTIGIVFGIFLLLFVLLVKKTTYFRGSTKSLN